MADQEAVETLAKSLKNALEQLDRLQAHVAAAHVDAGLQALLRQFNLAPELSKSD